MSDRKKKKEPKLYCKEKSLLQLPVFCFDKPGRKKEVSSSWEEDGRKCKITCYSAQGVPGSLEQDVYAACMRLWVIQRMPRWIELQYSDICKTLNLNPVYWRSPIKKALLKLGAARYEFKQCFIDAKKRTIRKIAYFSLFDTTEFEEAAGQIGGRWEKNKLYFPEELKLNLDERYYQWLDFHLYTSLKSGVPRRLYEFLEKRRYHKVEDTFQIHESKLFRWIPINSKNLSKSRKTIRDATDELIAKKYLADYQWDRKRKICYFVYGKTLPRMSKDIVSKEPVTLKPVLSPEEHPKGVDPKLLPDVLSHEVAKQATQQEDKKKEFLREEQLQTLFSLLKRKTEKLMEVITHYYDQEGFDYVSWNIRYTNQKANKNYSTYLKKALESNWALDWKQEQQAIDQESKRQQFSEQQQMEQEKESREKHLDSDRAEFEQQHAQLPSQVKQRLLEQADSETPQQQIKREMNVKIRYVQLVREYLNQQGENFSQEVIKLLPFVSQIAAEANFS